jgi:dihydroorotase
LKNQLELDLKLKNHYTFMRADLTLKNCRIWQNKRLKKASLVIDKGKIISITKSRLPPSKKKTDCKGSIVLPGLIDVHVHFREPGLSHKEDWSTGSRAAAKGGITYIMDMPNTIPPTITLRDLFDKKELAKKSVVNFGLYAGISQSNLNDLKELVKQAVAFKLYMGESTGDLALEDISLQIKAFANVAKTKKVLCVHAENEKMNKYFYKDYKKETDPLAYARSRPPESEVLAINDAIELARQTNVKLHICHVSTKDGLSLIKKAKKSKIDVTCETCPHYLFMTEEDLKKKGTFAKMNPPLRTEKDQKALWKGIKDRTIDIIASDHAPHSLEEKYQNIWFAPAGVPGVETTLQIMLNAVNKKMIKLEKVVELMHDNPVKRFGLGNYGNIEVGNDANLTVIDLNEKWKISRDDLLTKCGWSPYEDWEGKGMAIMTIVNGNVVFS